MRLLYRLAFQVDHYISFSVGSGERASQKWLVHMSQKVRSEFNLKLKGQETGKGTMKLGHAVIVRLRSKVSWSRICGSEAQISTLCRPYLLLAEDDDYSIQRSENQAVTKTAVQLAIL